MLKSSLRLLRQYALAACIGFAALAGPAHAQQQPTPPEHYTLDPRGVDLISGGFTHAAVDLVIGQPDQGGIVHGRVYANGGWRDMLSGTISISGSTYVVSLGAESEVFTLSGSTFTPVSNNGSTLTQSGSTFTFTTSSGSVATYSTAYATSTTAYVANGAVLMGVTTPAGETTNLVWEGITYCVMYDIVTGDCLGYANATRVKSVRNNRGYQVNFSYESSDPPSPTLPPGDEWLRRTGAVGVNLAYEYCDPMGNGCPGLTGTWPSVTYASTQPYGGSVTSVTDQSNRTTIYSYAGSALTGIRLPGSTTDDVVIGYDGLARVSAVTDASGAWTYGYADVGTTRTTTAAGPLGQQMVAVSDLTTERATSVANALGNTIRYQYDGQRRLERVTPPDGTASGGYVQLAYDGRGNVTSSTAVPKVGSGLSNIVTSAVYPASCTSPGVSIATCNRPISTTDGRSAVTDYVWNTSHGGLESVTGPAPTLGATRPQTRVGYASQTAYYRNSPTTFTTGSAITLPTTTSACASGVAPACVGTTAESLTTIAYPTSGTPNNLQPTSSTSGDGTGVLAAKTSFTYDRNGDVATVDGPLGSGGVGVDVTTYRYDSARRLTGAIGPDPDGGGAGLNRAQRMTLNDRNQPELVEIGSTSGVSWPSFTTLQRQSAVYGAYGRALTVADETAAGAKMMLAQFSYDAAGRIDCTAVRMNPSLWGSLPGSACTSQTPGDFGPDRISQNAYDAAGRVISSTSGLGSTTPITESVTYTANGQPETLTDGRNSTSAIEYDGFDRPARMRYPDPSTGAPSTTDDELYAYDANSNQVTFTNRSGQVLTSTFDALNRATATSASGSTTPPNPALTPPVTMTYDLLDRPLTASVTGGVSTAFTWDALGRLMREAGPTGNMDYGYDVAGRQINQFWPDGFVTGYVWNDVGEMIYINVPSGTIAAYAYDDLGRRTILARSNGISTTYGYDGISRLNALNHLGSTNVSLAFGHNPANQIVIRTMSNSAYAYAGSTGTTSYTLDRQNRIVGFGYDNNGNLANDGVRTYGYDAANRLTGGGSPAGSLSYDGLGRLDTLVGANGGRYLYSGAEAVAFADPSTNVIANHFVRGPGVDEIVANYPTATLANPLFWMLDERNSVMALTDIAGGTPYTNGYDEYGNPRSGNLGRFQYTGQLLMPDFGAYHYKARAYLPGLGRFLQTDPIGYAAGANLYAYVRNDPIGFTDPDGLQEICITDGDSPTGETCTEIDPAPVFRDRDTGGGAFRALLDSIWGTLSDPSRWPQIPDPMEVLSPSCPPGMVCAVVPLDAIIGGRASANRIVAAAGQISRNRLTYAGVALQKHGVRPGSAFPRVGGRAAEINSAGQRIVEEIVQHQQSAFVRNRFGGWDVIHPDGRGVRYMPDNSVHLLEP